MKENPFSTRVLVLIASVGASVFGFQLMDLNHAFQKNWLEDTFVFRGILLAICGIISILYVVRIGKRNWRELPLLKIFLVVTVYYVLCYVLPYESFASFASQWKEVGTPFQLQSLFIFLFIFGVALLFDVVDIEVDPPNQKTIPQVIGKKNSIYLSAGLMMPQILYFLFTLPYHPFHFIGLMLFVLFFIGFWKYHKFPMYINFWGEALLALLGIYYSFI